MKTQTGGKAQWGLCLSCPQKQGPAEVCPTFYTEDFMGYPLPRKQGDREVWMFWGHCQGRQGSYYQAISAPSTSSPQGYVTSDNFNALQHMSHCQRVHN